MTISELTFSCSISCHTSWGSNLAISTIFAPTKLWPMTAHWVAPCINGAIGRWVMTPLRPFSTISSGFSARVFVIGSTPPPRA